MYTKQNVMIEYSLLIIPTVGIVPLTHSSNFDHKRDINGMAGHAYHDIFITTSWDGFLKVCFIRATTIQGKKSHRNEIIGMWQGIRQASNIAIKDKRVVFHAN